MTAGELGMGILGDNMGTGKTLDSLMLVLARPPPLEWAAPELPQQFPYEGTHLQTL